MRAAAIDGATPWQADCYITLPLMRNVCELRVTLQGGDGVTV